MKDGRAMSVTRGGAERRRAALPTKPHDTTMSNRMCKSSPRFQYFRVSAAIPLQTGHPPDPATLRRRASDSGGVMSDETSRELLASLTATLAELETGASGSDPTAAARAFDAMMQRRRLERDRAAKAALAEATRPPERPWFDEALPPRYPTKESCSECGTSPPPRVADAPLRPPRERLSRVPRPKAPRRRHRRVRAVPRAPRLDRRPRAALRGVAREQSRRHRANPPPSAPPSRRRPSRRSARSPRRRFSLRSARRARLRRRHAADDRV